ncbi:MAG: biofilm synthesis protein PgaD [Burkholderiales bacterium]
MQMIIDQPGFVPLSRRVGWGCVTVLCWAVWIYLWLPVVTLVAWGMGFYQAYTELGWKAEVIELRRLLVLYLCVAAIFGGCLLLWALLEYTRFRRQHRRARPVQAEVPELAAYTGLRSEDISIWRKCRCVVAHHDEYGVMRGADNFHVPAAAAAPLNQERTAQPARRS